MTASSWGLPGMSQREPFGEVISPVQRAGLPRVVKEHRAVMITPSQRGNVTLVPIKMTRGVHLAQK